ncbi:MAG: hypothetical protein ATN35_00665 [Epulopiscium sp. Nele67-Bin004]|nr:MAG: hypothetical protein ATN35_00665 [Epulopiscium sp. Nele67-Bin004]
MDTVVWIISNHNVFMNDYYKDKWKKVEFYKRDYWEVYCHYDMNELVDYLNYPLHYNNFKGSDLKIVYDMPIIYEYLYKVKERFNQVNTITLCALEPVLLWYLYNNDLLSDLPLTIGQETKFYEVVKQGKIITLKEIEEEEDMDYVNVPMSKTSELLVCEEDTLDKLDLAPFSKETKEQLRNILVPSTNDLETVFNQLPILCPATIRVSPKNAEKFLDVNDVLVKDSLVPSGSFVNKGDTLFEYTHEVKKLFGKKDVQTISKVSDMTGIIKWHVDLNKNDIWAKKEEIIGTIIPKQ